MQVFILQTPKMMQCRVFFVLQMQQLCPAFRKLSVLPHAHISISMSISVRTGLAVGFRHACFAVVLSSAL